VSKSAPVGWRVLLIVDDWGPACATISRWYAFGCPTSGVFLKCCLTIELSGRAGLANFEILQAQPLYFLASSLASDSPVHCSGC
jgi:hypothetical protein